jgi:hypothetical protein
MDPYTPVTSDYSKGDNRFTGKINTVTIELKNANALTESAKKEAEDALDID